jgi:hypothetical protein
LEEFGAHAQIVRLSRVSLFVEILLEGPAQGAHPFAAAAVILVYGLQGHASSSASKVNCQNGSSILFGRASM